MNDIPCETVMFTHGALKKNQFTTHKIITTTNPAAAFSYRYFVSVERKTEASTMSRCSATPGSCPPRAALDVSAPERSSVALMRDLSRDCVTRAVSQTLASCYCNRECMKRDVTFNFTFREQL